MSLKCSVFGCDYGDEETDRTTEARDGQHIERVERRQVCNRCGDVKVVGENTQVRSADQRPAPADAASSPESEFEADPTPATATDSLSAAETAIADGGDSNLGDPTVDDDAVFIDADDGDDTDADVDSMDEPTTGAETDPQPVDTTTIDEPDDDAVFIDEGPGMTDDTTVQDTPESADDDSTPMGRPDDSMDGDQGVEIMEGTTETSAPAASESNASDATVSDEPASASATESVNEVERAGLGAYNLDAESGESETVLSCTSCGNTLSTDETPRRAGDSCPRCTGWLIED